MNIDKPNALWTHLHWLSVLAQQGSYTRTAARLQVSKAAVSNRIAELEAAAGVQLVQRTTRSVRLTEAGSSLVNASREPFEQLSAALEAAREYAAEPTGLLRVTVPVALARQHLGPVLVQYARSFPRVRVELELSDALRSLSAEGYDVAIRHSQQVPETHVAWRLAPTRALLVASAPYLRRHGTPTTPQELAEHACLHYPRPHATTTWSFAKSTQGRAKSHPDIVTVAVKGPLAVNNSELLRDAAAAGIGIALVPDFSAQSALKSGRLVSVLREWKSVGVFGEWLHAVRPYGARVPASVQEFVKLLRAHFEQGFGEGG